MKYPTISLTSINKAPKGFCSMDRKKVPYKAAIVKGKRAHYICPKHGEFTAKI